MVLSPGLFSSIATVFVAKREGGWSGDDSWNPSGSSSLGSVYVSVSAQRFCADGLLNVSIHKPFFD
jgi:hypothetical protein